MLAKKTFNDPKIRRSTAVLYKKKYRGTGTKKVPRYSNAVLLYTVLPTSGNNVYRLAAISYFAITFSIRALKRNTLIANKIELN